MIIAMRAHATKPDAPPKLICLMMSGRGRCPHLRRPDKRGSTVHVNKEFRQQFQNYAPPSLRVIRTNFARTIYNI